MFFCFPVSFLAVAVIALVEVLVAVIAYDLEVALIECECFHLCHASTCLYWSDVVNSQSCCHSVADLALVVSHQLHTAAQVLPSHAPDYLPVVLVLAHL